MRLEDHRRLIKRLKENGYHITNQFLWMEREMYLWFESLRLIE